MTEINTQMEAVNDNMEEPSNVISFKNRQEQHGRQITSEEAERLRLNKGDILEIQLGTQKKLRMTGIEVDLDGGLVGVESVDGSAVYREEETKVTSMADFIRSKTGQQAFEALLIKNKAA